MKKSKIPIPVKKESISKKSEDSISKKIESSQKELSNDKPSKLKNSMALEKPNTVPTLERSLNSNDEPCLEDNTKKSKSKKKISTKKKIKKVKKVSSKKTKRDNKEIVPQMKSPVQTESIPKILDNDAELYTKIGDVSPGEKEINQVTGMNGEKRESLSIIKSNLNTKISSIEVESQTNQRDDTLSSVHQKAPEPFPEKSHVTKNVRSRASSFIPLNVIENEEIQQVKLAEKDDSKVNASDLQSTVNTAIKETHESNKIQKETTNGSKYLKSSIKLTDKNELEPLKGNILSCTKHQSIRNSSVTPIEIEEKTMIGLNNRKGSVKSIAIELQENDVSPQIKSQSRRNSSITCTDDETEMILANKEALVKSIDSELIKNDPLRPKKSPSNRSSSIIPVHTKKETRKSSVDIKKIIKPIKKNSFGPVKNDLLPSTKPLSRRNSSIIQVDANTTVEVANRKTSVNSIDSESLKSDILSRRNSSIVQIDAELVDRKTSCKSIDSEQLKKDPLSSISRRNSSIIEINTETTVGLADRKTSSNSVDFDPPKDDPLLPKKVLSPINSSNHSIDNDGKIVVDTAISKTENIVQLSPVSQNKTPSRRNSIIEIFQKLIGKNSESKCDKNEIVYTNDDSSRAAIPTEKNKPVKLGKDLSDTLENQKQSDNKSKVHYESFKDEEDHTNHKRIKKDVTNESKKVNDRKTSIQMENTNRDIKSTDKSERSSSTNPIKESKDTSKLTQDSHHNLKSSITRRKSLKIPKLSNCKSSSKKRSKSFDSTGSESNTHLLLPSITDSSFEVNTLQHEKNKPLKSVKKLDENINSIETVKSDVQKMLNQKVSKNEKLELLQSLLASLVNEDNSESSEIPNPDQVQTSRMKLSTNQKTEAPITEAGEEMYNLEYTESEKSEEHNLHGTMMKSLVAETNSDRKEERINILQTKYSTLETSQKVSDKRENNKDGEVFEEKSSVETSIVESTDTIKISQKESIISVGQPSVGSSSEKKVGDEGNVNDKESYGDYENTIESDESLNEEKLKLYSKKSYQREVGSNSPDSLEGSEIESLEEEEYVSEFDDDTDDAIGSNIEQNLETDDEVKEIVSQDNGSAREESLESEYELEEEESFESEYELEKAEEMESEYEFEEEEELESEYELEEEEEQEFEHEPEEKEELESIHEFEQDTNNEDKKGDDKINDNSYVTPKEDSITEIDESLEHDISSSLEKALESIETLKVLERRISIDFESINELNYLIDESTVINENDDNNLTGDSDDINISKFDLSSRRSTIVEEDSRAIKNGIADNVNDVDIEIIVVEDEETIEKETLEDEEGHKVDVQSPLFENPKDNNKIQETGTELIIQTSTKEDETKKALDKILHLMEKLARRSSLLSEENKRKSTNMSLQTNIRSSLCMSMHEEPNSDKEIKTMDGECYSCSRKQSIISTTSSKGNTTEIMGEVEEVIKDNSKAIGRKKSIDYVQLSRRASLSTDHQLSEGINSSSIPITIAVDCQVAEEDDQKDTLSKASRSSSLMTEDQKIQPECKEDTQQNINSDPQMYFAKEVEVALENIIEMKSTMAKMMALLEKTSLDQRKPYNDTDSVRSLISQISLYSDMVQDIMPVIQEKDTEDPLDRSPGRRASTTSITEDKSSSTLPSPPSFTAFYNESPMIIEEVSVSSTQVVKDNSDGELNKKENIKLKVETSSMIDEKMKFFDGLSKTQLVREGDTEKVNNQESLMVKKSTILEGVSEDSLLPVSKQRQVFEREAMRAMFEEVSLQKQVPGKVSDSEFAPWVLPKNYGLSESLTHNPFIYNDPIHKRITKSAEDLTKCCLCHEEKITSNFGTYCSLCKKEQGIQSNSGNISNSMSMQNITQSPVFIIKVQDAESQTFEDEFDNGNILYDNYSRLSNERQKSSLILRSTNETTLIEQSSSIKGDQSTTMEPRDVEESSSPMIFQETSHDSSKDFNHLSSEDLCDDDMREEVESVRSSNTSIIITSSHNTPPPIQMIETIEKAISPFSPHDFEKSFYDKINAANRHSESNLKNKLFKLSVSMDDLDQADSLTISFSGSNINISSSTQLLAKSNIDISSGEFGTHFTLRPNLKRSLSTTSSRPKDEIEIQESMYENENVKIVIEEELSEMKTETDNDEEQDSVAETVIEIKSSSNEYFKDRFEFDLPPSKLYYFDDDPLNSPPKELGVEDKSSLDDCYIFGTQPERKSPSLIQSSSSEKIMMDQQSPSEMDDDMMEDKRADHEGASNETLSSLLESVRVNENKFEINDRDFQDYEDDISHDSRYDEEDDDTFDDDSCAVEGMRIGKYTKLNRRPIVSRPRKFLRFSSQVGGHKESDISNKESKLYKILFIGSSSAGKTSIIRRYVKHTFTPSYRATIGADFLSKVIQWDEAVTLRLQLWDIAGQDRFSLLSRSFYKDAVGAFIVCDISRPDTLDACIPWKEELDTKVQTSEGGRIPCFLLANKCDLVEDSTVQSKLTSKVCQLHGFHGWMQTSAKEDINITQAIEMLLRQIVKQDIDSTPFATDQESLVLENEGRKKKRSGCLC